MKTFGDGTKLVAVAVEATSLPAWYRCQVELRDRQGQPRAESFEWPAPRADTDAKR